MAGIESQMMATLPSDAQRVALPCAKGIIWEDRIRKPGFQISDEEWAAARQVCDGHLVYQTQEELMAAKIEQPQCGMCGFKTVVLMKCDQGCGYLICFMCTVAYNPCWSVPMTAEEIEMSGASETYRERPMPKIQVQQMSKQFSVKSILYVWKPQIMEGFTALNRLSGLVKNYVRE